MYRVAVALANQPADWTAGRRSSTNRCDTSPLTPQPPRGRPDQLAKLSPIKRLIAIRGRRFCTTRKFDELAEFVDQSQLIDGPARRFQKFWAGNHDRQALGTR
jgi:hypothetical protein